MTIRPIVALYHLILTASFMTTRISRAMTTSSSKQKLILHWFRHGDLRIHDNQALAYSIQNSDACLPIFCFDSSIFGDEAKTPYGILKCGPRRAKFITEAVVDLRSNLKGNLVVAHGEPGQVFDSILNQIKNLEVDVSIVCQEEPLKEEKDQVRSVRASLKKHNARGTLKELWGSTLYDLVDLPYTSDLSNMPDGFTPFRTQVEKSCKIPKPLGNANVKPLSANLQTAFAKQLTFVPSLVDLGYTNEQIERATVHDTRSVMQFQGGETAALARLTEYIHKKSLLRVYFETRNGMLGADYSTKLSPWLAHGCVSARQIAVECKRYEVTVVANKSTYWLVFELVWRDFCKFFCYKHGNQLFFPGGTIGKDVKWSHFAKNFDAWKHGKTGYPLVDANMRELTASGFMSNRGRQNVASFLALDLNHDWRMGGDWFESELLDYDVYSNWVVRNLLLRSC
jgi:deoxyribodipyrimidine photo-lyase